MCKNRDIEKKKKEKKRMEQKLSKNVLSQTRCVLYAFMLMRHITLYLEIYVV